MLKIGDFSMLTKISIYMLRHYNEIGLLIPAQIDEFTGYRYYSEEQLPVANRIQALKGMGFSLSIIKEVITEYKDEEGLKKYLILQATQKKEEIAALERQLLLLETTIRKFGSCSNLPKCSIAIKELPKRNVISYRTTMSAYTQEGELWESLSTVMASQKVQLANPPYDIAIYYNHGFAENELDVEVQRSIFGSYQDTEDVKFKKVEAITAATMTFKGGYYQLEEVNQEIANWVCDNGYDFAGPLFNIYHVSPETEHMADNLITEVCFPIIKL
ncbi:MerR family transcriptional regulator [Oscillospiraceae bacterium PP1C4]